MRQIKLLALISALWVSYGCNECEPTNDPGYDLVVRFYNKDNITETYEMSFDDIRAEGIEVPLYSDITDSTLHLPLSRWADSSRFELSNLISVDTVVYIIPDIDPDTGEKNDYTIDINGVTATVTGDSLLYDDKIIVVTTSGVAYIDQTLGTTTNLDINSNTAAEAAEQLINCCGEEVATVNNDTVTYARHELNILVNAGMIQLLDIDSVRYQTALSFTYDRELIINDPDCDIHENITNIQVSTNPFHSDSVLLNYIVIDSSDVNVAIYADTTSTSEGE